ncbi:hypothetical protein Bca101_017512 [Brassica carinata]
MPVYKAVQRPGEFICHISHGLSCWVQPCELRWLTGFLLELLPFQTRESGYYTYGIVRTTKHSSCISSVADIMNALQVNRRGNCCSCSESKLSEEVASSSNKKTWFFSAVHDEPVVGDQESDVSDSEIFRVKRLSSLKLESGTVVLDTRDSEHHQEHKRLKKWHRYHKGRYSLSSSISRQGEEMLVVSSRKKTNEQQHSDVRMKNENHFVGGFKRLKVKQLIRP